MKILIGITKYPVILEKFKNGNCNGGWLTEADSVIRNRAAVLLGFSVSAHAGAVGSHVDINPELSNCSGFAALEHLMYAHSNEVLILNCYKSYYSHLHIYQFWQFFSINISQIFNPLKSSQSMLFGRMYFH